jgi:2-aminoadipate transaminase
MVQFAARIRDLHASPIREILAVVEQPGMISFAGGLPAAATFPSFDFSDVPLSSFQYGATEGDPRLRRLVATQLVERGLSVTPEHVLILSGSQQGIDLVAKLLVDTGTRVGVESPTYLAALQVLRLFGADIKPFEKQNPQTLADLDARLVYLNPTFQNPTGYCYSSDERHSIAAVCDASGTLLFEDDPYRDLVYDSCDRQPICALLKHTSWVYQGSFSKSLAPGLRLGYLACSNDLIVPLSRLKQAADLHSSRLAQHLVFNELTADHYRARLDNLVGFYRSRRDSFEESLSQHFAGLAKWRLPPGGLFFWLQLAEKFDTRALLPQAIKRGVAFMPGEPFFADENPPHGALRLNFSHASPEQAAQGLAILAALIREHSRL